MSGLVEFLTRAGAIPFAITGRTQLDALVAGNRIVDVAVCSMDIPSGSDGDGVDCLRTLRQAYAKSIGLIATSAQGIETFKTTLAPLDVVFVKKPASAEEVTRRIKALLQVSPPSNAPPENHGS
jgi:DNA-binding response OmpR family regulator